METINLEPNFTFIENLDSNNIVFEADGKALKITFYDEDIIRFNYRNGAVWERDFSYAVVKTSNKVAYKLSEIKNHIEIVLKHFNISIDKTLLTVIIKDKKGHIITQDSCPIMNEIHYENGSNKITYKKEIIEGEHFYGLGDKPEHPDLRGKKFTIWGTDQYGYYHYTDPLYKNIPFYIGLHSYQSYGVFIDNTYKSVFDFGQEKHDLLEIQIEGGELNYYFIYGPEMIDVTSRYTLLTGTPELPPMWALGYQQCKWSYFPESKVYEVTKRLRSESIPCDVFYLDIDYMEGFRCFTWDKEKFPDPKKMISSLKQDGFKTVVIVDPGIKIDDSYSIFTEALEKGYFCKAGEGGYISGKVWPGECYFPDFTNPAVRAWWADLFQDLIAEIGVNGVWNDMNEPALFDVPNKSFPLTVRHDFDGEESSHKRAHNIYGMQMSRATYDGVKKYAHPNRPFVITRSTYSGGQRFSSAWTGDNIASWDHLLVANTQTQRLSISGFSFCGSDIGGFIDQPSPEMYVRWVALAMMHPFFRTHSSGDHGDQEPWSFGQEALNHVRKFIQIRYKFLPYIYSAFYEYVKYGKPMLRPIYMYDQHDFHTHYRADEVVHGNHVLYAPIIGEGVISRNMFFPKGNWYYYYDNTCYEGSKEHNINVPLDESPLFIKEGAVIPHYPVMNFVGEEKIEVLYLNIYYKKGDETSFLYEDKGDGYDYTSGGFNEVHFNYSFDGKNVKISQDRNGNFLPEYKMYEIKFIGFPTINSVIIDGIPKSFILNKLLVKFDFEECIVL
jgi:alpha-glucosidase